MLYFTAEAPAKPPPKTLASQIDASCNTTTLVPVKNVLNLPSIRIIQAKKTALLLMSNPQSPPGNRADKRIHAFTESFDAATALHSPIDALESTLPTARDRAIFRKAASLNNIAACSTIETAPFRILRPKQVVRPPPAPAVAAMGRVKRTRGEEEGDKLGGRVAPKHGILSRMHAKAAERSGPLSLLERAVRMRLRVRVVVRETHEIKGEVSGRLVAFDKHFNMVVQHAGVADVGRAMRRVAQLFVRGENVVLVALS